MRRLLEALLVLAALALPFASPDAARAQTPCNGAITDLSFGATSGLAGTTLDATATVSITCTANFDILACVHLGRGGGAGWVAGPREVASGGNRVDIELYANAARTQVWRTIGTTAGAQGTAPLIIPRGNAVTRTQTIYGRLTLGADAPGAYAQSFVANSDVVVQGNVLANLSAAQRNCNRDHSYSVPFSFDVTASVSSYCDVTGGALDFGTTGPMTGAIDATGGLTIGCTSGTAYSVSLGNGLHASGAQRRMATGGNTLDYDLYTDAARTQPWQGTTVATATGSGNTVTIPVYGRVPPQGAPPPGNYSDTVVITMTY